MENEFIFCEPESCDAWTCLCGNMPHTNGFFPCDFNGKLVEPTPTDWTSGLYACLSCGRLINPDTLAVVGQAGSNAMLPDED